MKGIRIVSSTHILAVDGTFEVDAPDGRVARQRAALYTTMAAAARLAKGGPFTSLAGWVRATHLRASTAPAGELMAQMTGWASVAKDRHALLGPVCDLLLLRVRREKGVLSDATDEVPARFHDAAVELFGHDVGACQRDCQVCDLGRAGDWARALRATVGDSVEIVAAALADAYRAARRSGNVAPVRPMLDPDASLARPEPQGGSRPSAASGPERSDRGWPPVGWPEDEPPF